MAGFGASSSIYLFSEGGMLIDLAIGGQKFIFKPAGLGRLRTAEDAIKGAPAGKAQKQHEKGEERGEEEQQAGESERPGEHPG
jgi:hypothetical protein